MFNRKSSFVLAWLAMLSLTGSQCTFVATSGNSHSDKKDENNSGLLVIISDDQLFDDPVQGVRFVSGSLSGITSPEGEYQYQQGNPVSFFIGDIALGEAVEGKPVVTPLDLAPGGNIDTPAVINIARLLLSLDSRPDDGRITIPSALRMAAVRTNRALSPSIQFLDFTNETAFVNAASQLVATLTATYPFTAVLVDAESARHRLELH